MIFCLFVCLLSCLESFPACLVGMFQCGSSKPNLNFFAVLSNSSLIVQTNTKFFSSGSTLSSIVLCRDPAEVCFHPLLRLLALLCLCVLVGVLPFPFSADRQEDNLLLEDNLLFEGWKKTWNLLLFWWFKDIALQHFSFYSWKVSWVFKISWLLNMPPWDFFSSFPVWSCFLCSIVRIDCNLGTFWALSQNENKQDLSE